MSSLKFVFLGGAAVIATAFLAGCASLGSGSENRPIEAVVLDRTLTEGLQETVEVVPRGNISYRSEEYDSMYIPVELVVPSTVDVSAVGFGFRIREGARLSIHDGEDVSQVASGDVIDFSTPRFFSARYPDGTVARSMYLIQVRTPANGVITNLRVGDAELMPAFDPEILEYEVVLPFTATRFPLFVGGFGREVVIAHPDGELRETVNPGSIRPQAQRTTSVTAGSGTVSSADPADPSQLETLSLSDLGGAASGEAIIEQALRGGYDYELGFTDSESGTYGVNLIGGPDAAETTDYTITAVRGEPTGVWADITGTWSLADAVVPDDGSTRFGMDIDDSELTFRAVWDQGGPNIEWDGGIIFDTPASFDGESQIVLEDQGFLPSGEVAERVRTWTIEWIDRKTFRVVEASMELTSADSDEAATVPVVGPPPAPFSELIYQKR